MTRFTYWTHTLMPLIGMLLTLLCDGIRFLCLCLRPSPALAAENLFLRKQLALYQERHVTPRRITHTTRMALIWLTRWFDWRQAIALVRPATLMRWHRQGFRLGSALHVMLFLENPLQTLCIFKGFQSRYGQ
jgi:putative transposase